MEGAYDSKEQNSFWQFSDQLRLETTTTTTTTTTTNLSSLSLGDSIWSDSSVAKRADDRRNFVGPVSAQSSELGWKLALGLPQKLAFGANAANPAAAAAAAADRYRYNNNNNNTASAAAAADNGAYNSSKKGPGDASNGMKYYWNCYNSNNNYSNGEINNYYYSNKHGNGGDKNRIGDNNDGIRGSGKKKNSNGKNNSSGGNGYNGAALDKRFKTLPPSEALPRNEAVGGYIFVCNNETMEENLQRQLFGLPPRYKDSVRAITPGLPLFLYNYSTHQLHGIFEATSFGGTNIDPIAWEDKKCPGESRFPAQVRVMTRKLCEPLEEDAFRPILHHYDGPKFRLELNVQEALALLDIFAEQNA